METSTIFRLVGFFSLRRARQVPATEPHRETYQRSDLVRRAALECRGYGHGGACEKILGIVHEGERERLRGEDSRLESSVYDVTCRPTPNGSGLGLSDRQQGVVSELAFVLNSTTCHAFDLLLVTTNIHLFRYYASPTKHFLYHWPSHWAHVKFAFRQPTSCTPAQQTSARLLSRWSCVPSCLRFTHNGH